MGIRQENKVSRQYFSPSSVEKNPTHLLLHHSLLNCVSERELRKGMSPDFESCACHNTSREDLS
jgi:hypothetical protein